ncbi:hypothetical protein BHE74_00008794 [Ensete ventricosum]|nr:hypothetical protein BHE74_00008794 [Ensete ventricosum]
MSQDRLSCLFPNRAAEEPIPPTPTVATIPQVAVASSAPQAGPTDVELSVLTPDRYWRLLTDPGLTPLVHTLSQMIPAEAFFGLAH